MFRSSCVKNATGVNFTNEGVDKRFLRKFDMYRIVAFVSAWAIGVSAFAAGTLQIASPTVEGSQVTIPVVLGGESASSVSAMDFRLTYNPDVLRPVSASAGAVAEEAGKRIMANLSNPGEYVVVMMGMNQTTCSAGEVAKVVMERVSDSALPDWGLGIARPTLSSLEGAEIATEVIPFETEEETSNSDTPSSPTAGTDKAASGTNKAVPEGTARLTELNKQQGKLASRTESKPGSTRDELARALANRDRIRGQVNDEMSVSEEEAKTSPAPSETTEATGSQRAGVTEKESIASASPTGMRKVEHKEAPTTVEPNRQAKVTAEAQGGVQWKVFIFPGVLAIIGVVAIAMALARHMRKA